MCCLKIVWWVIVGMLLSWTVSYFRERLWVKREPELVHQIQAQPQPLQYSQNAAHIFLVVLVLAGVFGIGETRIAGILLVRLLDLT